jgi:hypothetical protein
MLSRKSNTGSFFTLSPQPASREEPALMVALRWKPPYRRANENGFISSHRGQTEHHSLVDEAVRKFVGIHRLVPRGFDAEPQNVRQRGELSFLRICTLTRKYGRYEGKVYDLSGSSGRKRDRPDHPHAAALHRTIPDLADGSLDKSEGVRILGSKPSVGATR